MNKTPCYSLIFVMSFSLYAEPKKQEKLPDMAFFEYLADMVEVDGQLVGPLDLKPSSTDISPNTQSKKVKLKLDKNETKISDTKDAKNNSSEGKSND